MPNLYGDGSIFDNTEQQTEFLQDVKNILHNMLGMCYGYSDEKADELFLYINIANGQATMDTMYIINNHLLNAHTLNNAKINHQFDTSHDRQLKLQELLASDLIQRLLPLFINEGKIMPNEIWASFNTKNNDFKVRIGYALDPKNIVESAYGLEEWRNYLEHPETSTYNLADDEYLLHIKK